MKYAHTAVVVFDDHLIFAETFTLLLERINLFESVHTCTEEDALIHFMMNNHNKPVILFLDYYLKEGTALYLINELRRINKQIKIVVLSSVVNPVLIQNILAHNLNGFISKSSGTDIILECLRSVQKGEKYICPYIRNIIDNHSVTDNIKFTDREIYILQHFAQGLSIAETAEKTILSKHTIVAHRRKMMAKVHCKSITELLAYARKTGLI